MKLLCLFFFCLIFPISHASAANKRLLIVGDSLTEGYGIAQDKAYPALLQTLLRQKQHAIDVINAGSSGSTTASAVSRLRWHLKNKPDLLLLALGANDGLRGFNPEASSKNLAQAIELAQSHGVKVVLAGMQMPMNYSKGYREKFAAVFPQLAKKYNLALVPFLLEGVATQKNLNQPDGIHPNEKGHEVMARYLLPYIEKNL